MNSELLICFQVLFSSSQNGFGSLLQVKDSRTMSQLTDKFFKDQLKREKNKNQPRP